MSAKETQTMELSDEERRRIYEEEKARTVLRQFSA
jgi:hypothetical protein